MKLGRAPQDEIDALMRWLQDRENAKFEDAKNRPPPFMRVVFGYETLVNNCCDKTADTLEWSPELTAAKAKAALLDFLSGPDVFARRQLQTQVTTFGWWTVGFRSGRSYEAPTLEEAARLAIAGGA